MKSYFTFLSRNKLYTAINVIGLAISLMFVILLGDFSWRQLSMDTWHKNADRIMMIGNTDSFFFWPQATEEIQAICPEIESSCRLLSHSGKVKSEKHELMDSDHPIILITDQSFFDFFDFKLKFGDRNTVLNAPDKCVITESLANQLFPGENPMGKTLQIEGDQYLSFDSEEWLDSTLVYRVTGVIEELDRTVLPNETQLIVSMERYPQITGYNVPNNAYGRTKFGVCKAMFMLKPGLSLDGKADAIFKHIKENYSLGWVANKEDLSFTPLTKVMNAPQNQGNGLMQGDNGKWKLLLAVIFAVLFFAVSNYVNLTVVNASFRAKEMATRRLLGSSRAEITLKMMTESLLMVMVTFLLGLGMAFLFQQDFATLFQGIIALEKDINPMSVSVCVFFILVLSFISGFLPSLQISTLNPLDIVKGKLMLQNKMVLGKISIALQSLITVVMLSAVLIIHLQLNHLIQAPLGFNPENIYQLYFYGDQQNLVESKLKELPGVVGIGHMGGTGLTNENSAYYSIIKEDSKVDIGLIDVDKKAFELLGFQLANDYGLGDQQPLYLNEEALRQLGLPQDAKEFDRGGRVIPLSGVMKDFRRRNILNKVEPIQLRIRENDDTNAILVKTDGSKKTREQILAIVEEVKNNERSIESYISDMGVDIRKSFDDYSNTLDIILLFTGIAIVISIMGFVGMSLFFIRQNQKQIGIRRVMGSSIQEVFIHMLKIFCIPIILSLLIGIPLAYYIMDNWLNGFSYRIAQSPWIFIFSSLTTLGIALASVSIQIFRASTENPVESLKTE